MDWKKQIQRAPTISLTSSATYTRPPLAAHADPPINSTYRATLCVASAGEMAARCVESRRAGRSSNMVRDAANAVPLDVTVAGKARIDSSFAELTATRRANELAITQSQSQRMAPSATAAEAALGALIAAEPRHGIQSKIVQDDFALGGLDGAFPGSRSAYGKHCSEIYWQMNKNASGGRLHTVKMGRLAPNGTRLKNWNAMP